MKYTKTISSLIVAGAFIVNSSLMAVDEDKKPAAKTPYYLTVAGITDDQKEDLKTLFKEHTARLKAAGRNKAKRTAAGKQFHAKLKDIYSEEQLKEFYKKAEAAKKGKKK